MCDDVCAATAAAAACAGLFRGFGAFSAGGMPSYGAYFAGYNIAKEWAFRVRDAHAPRVPDAVLYFGCGIIADIAAMPLWIPVDVLMQRMALQNVGGQRRYSSYKGARRVCVGGGVRGRVRAATHCRSCRLPAVQQTR